MRKSGLMRLIFIAIVSALLWTPSMHADDVKMVLPPGHYQRHFGQGKLEDPLCRTYAKTDVRNKVVVAIFSSPNMSNGDAQRKWVDLLANNPETKLKDAVLLVLVEDMSQAGMFRDMALASMRKDFKESSRPLIVLDDTGDFSRRFGIPRDQTRILVFDKTGTLRDVEADLQDSSTTTHRLKVITGRLLAE
jgi:hypothetical protein